ncbi:hypothetical protein ACN2C7_14110 [Caulobacter sp. ErkDOM-E]|uniref:hypothetical protein n=1 Tax=Caulobacter sp. ErkDOM-E TaxID=3402778 RepID=UPI003AF44D82
MGETRDPRVVFAIGLARVLLSILVVYAFLATLMTASAQQSISAGLKDVANEDGKPVTYSQAYLAYKKSAELKKTRDQAWREHDAERKAMEKARSLRIGLEPAISSESDAFFSFRDRLRAQALCEFSPNASKLQDWETVQSCELRPRDQKIWDSLVARSPNFKQVMENASRADTAFYEARNSVDSSKEALDEADKQGQWALQVGRKFGDFDLLRGSWMAAGGLFEGFPPATLQILLAFMSGAFGALLIAQILIVYPENQLGLTKGEGFEARIGLGGMVAVCVYIILGSGAVLLGDASSLEGDANVMTFAGVGVLAGMFSDRVAAWLSERANFFFEARRKPGEDGGDGDGPTDDKPRPPGKTPPGAPEKRART